MLVAAVTIFVLLVRLVDVLGIDAAITGATTETAVRLLSAAYPGRVPLLTQPPPRGEASAPARGQDRVAVVLYDDAYVAGHAADRPGWPRPLAEHAALLDALVAAGARSVLFDLDFHHDRQDGAEVLAAAIGAARRRGREVVLLQRHGPPGWWLDCPADPVQGLPERPVRAGSLLPVLACAASRLAEPEWDSPFPGMVYPLAVERRGEALPAPAKALFDLARAPALPGALPEAPAAASAAAEAPAMLLAWGLPVSARMQAEDCIGGDGGLHVASRLLHVLPGLFGILRGVLQPACPYLDTLDAGAVLQAAAAAPAQPLRPLLQDRTVLVGVAVAATNDWVTAPLHGQLPGVFLHATALDNLLTFGGAYYPFDHGMLLGPLSREHAVALAATIAPGLVLLARLQARVPGRLRWARQRLRRGERPGRRLQRLGLRLATRLASPALAPALLTLVAVSLLGLPRLQALVSVVLVQAAELFILKMGALHHVLSETPRH